MSLLEKLPPIIDPLPGGKGVVNAVDFITNWARRNSLWPLVYGTSCCAIEMMATGASKHDWSRFGVEVARATPRQADLIILAGTIVEKMAPRLKILYDQMPSPKYVIAMGACTISGGPFYYDSYAVVKGADRIIPVDIFIPGCPPRPEALLYGIMQLQELIKKESFRNPRLPNPINTLPISDLHTLADKQWKVTEVEKQATLKETQVKFKEENPKYKGHSYTNKPKEDLPAIKREAPEATPGLSNVELYHTVKAHFPEIKIFEMEEVTDESLSAKGTDYILDLDVAEDQYLSVVNWLKNNSKLSMDYCCFLTAVDWNPSFDVVLQLLSTEHGHKISVRCRIEDRENPSLPTLSQIYRTTEWHEREVYDLFGITFTGHPDMRRIFLNELETEFVGYPLRKDWEDPSRVIKRPY